MFNRRFGLVLALAVVMALAVTDGASARRYRRHHVVRESAHSFVFRSPDRAALTSNLGKVGGYFLPGIFGATTADPYEHPGYGYYVGGGQGPGYYYPD